MSGGGDSQSSTATTSSDNRQVLDGGAIGISGSEGNSINILDAGAINSALNLAAPIVTSALQLARDVAEGAGKVVDRGVELQEAQGIQLSTAYTDAKGTKDVLVIGALLVGGVAIAYMLKK